MNYLTTVHLAGGTRRCSNGSCRPPAVDRQDEVTCARKNTIGTASSRRTNVLTLAKASSVILGRCENAVKSHPQSAPSKKWESAPAGAECAGAGAKEKSAPAPAQMCAVFSAVSAHSAPPHQIGVFTPHTGCPFLGTRPILLINHKNATLANPHAKRLSSVGASMLATCSGSPPNESGAVVAATTPLADHHHSPASLLHVVIP